MESITLGDKEFAPFIGEQKITKAVERISAKINDDIKGLNPVFISVLNGSYVFTADLMRFVSGSVELHFVKVSSYEGVNSVGKVNKLIGLDCELRGRNVVILEDIVDTGKTLEVVYEMIKEKEPAQIKVAALFLKPSVYKKNIPLHYVGMEIENDFVVGYGLDYNGLGRNLKDVYKLVSK